MAYIFTVILLIVSICLSGCGPLAAVGAIGTTINNAAYNEANRNINKSDKSRDEQALEVAIANMNLGVEYMKHGAYEKALFKLERSLQAKPDFAPTYNVLGLLYQRLGDSGKAEESFKKSLKLDGSDSSTYNNYGLFLCRNQRYAEAEEAFLNAANNPLYDSPEIAFTNAGICSLDRDKVVAENYFQKALLKNENFSPALFRMAELSYEHHNYESSYNYLKRYKQNARHTPKSLWLGVRVSKELGYDDEVSSYALLLRNQYPETAEAKMLSEWQF